jgi:hypothetical protein
LEATNNRTAKTVSVQSTRSLANRADWRFLLPTSSGVFEHLVLLGGSPPLRAWLEDTGVIKICSTVLPTQPCADVVAVLNGARFEPQEVAASLKPTGVLYWEFSRITRHSSGFSFRRAIQGLRSAGLTVVGTYAVAPSFSRPQMFLPLEVPRSLEWYIQSQYVAATARQRILEQAVTLLTNLRSDRLAPFAPSIAVIATIGAEHDRRPYVLNHPEFASLLRMTDDEPIRPILLTDRGSRVVVLPFARQDSHPRFILKIPKTSTFNDRTGTEQGVLQHIHGHLGDSSLRSTIPEPLGIATVDHIDMAIESYLAGTSLQRSSGRWGARRSQALEDLRLACTWLSRFHQEMTIERVRWNDDNRRLWFDSTLREYQSIFYTTPAEARMLELLVLRSCELTERELPIVYRHRDFVTPNTLRLGSRLSVIDWTGGTPGLPLCDLIQFVTSWYRDVQHTSQEASVHALFGHRVASDLPAARVHQSIHDYVDVLQFDRRFVPLLAVFTWIELALRRYRAQAHMQDVASDPRVGNEYVKFLSIMAESADHLFADS